MKTALNRRGVYRDRYGGPGEKRALFCRDQGPEDPRDLRRIRGILRSVPVRSQRSGRRRRCGRPGVVPDRLRHRMEYGKSREDGGKCAGRRLRRPACHAARPRRCPRRSGDLATPSCQSRKPWISASSRSGRRGNSSRSDLVKRFSGLEKVVAIKEESNAVDWVRTGCRAIGRRVPIITGGGENMAPYYYLAGRQRIHNGNGQPYAADVHRDAQCRYAAALEIGDGTPGLVRAPDNPEGRTRHAHAQGRSGDDGPCGRALCVARRNPNRPRPPPAVSSRQKTAPGSDAC